MIHLRNSPLFFMAIAVLIGLSTAGHAWSFLPESGSTWMPALALLIAMATILPTPYAASGLPTGLLVIMIICAAWVRHRDHQSFLYPAGDVAVAGSCAGIVQVKRVLKSSDTWLQLHCESLRLPVTSDSGPVPFADRYVLVRIYQPDTLRCLPGDLITVEGRVEPIEGAMNPGSWDMRKYYGMMGIRSAIFVMGEKAMHTGASQWRLNRWPAAWQRQLSDRVHRHMSPASAQLTNALVWGDRSDLNPEIRNAFADAGAMHVLSVSGMHVAMVYSVLAIFLGRPGRGSRRRNTLRLIAYVLAIAGYVLVTGASPAAVRAGCMILLYLAGRSFGLETQVWNLLGLAALGQMWADPGMIGQLGFQLSFLAMAGILLYTQPMIRAIPIRSRWIRWLWEITALSLAAQVFIVPLLLYHFHAFPLTFIVSSLVAMPAGYLVIVGSVVGLLLSAAGIDAWWPVLDTAVEWFLRVMMQIADWNPEMHYAFPRPALIAGMAAAILFAIYWQYRWKPAYGMAMAAGAACLLAVAGHRIIQWERDEIVLYHTRKGWLIDVFSAGDVYTLRHPDVDAGAEQFAARSLRADKDIRRVITLLQGASIRRAAIRYEGPSLIAGHQRWVIWSDTTGLPGPDVTDVVVITARADMDRLEDWLGHSTPVLVLTASIPRRDLYRWRRWLERKELPYHDSATAGAYRLRL